MRWVYVCLAVGLLLVVAPAGALVPDGITVNTSSDWLTAGSGETATVTVHVTNSTSGNTSFEGVEVELAVDGEYGSISPGCVELDSSGSAAATFRPGTRSGTAEITATVLCDEMDEPLVECADLYIDHATPNKVVNLWCESEVTAGGTTDITVRMADQYGNLVDDRREAEAVKFMVGSPGGRATFDGDTSEITKSVDESGNATVTLKVDTLAGENVVLVEFPGNIGSRYLTIKGLANGEPSEIHQSVSPKVTDPDPKYYPELPLDEQFTITYALYDEYGNPAGDRQIKVNALQISGSLTSGEWFLKTNSLGKAQITYGPSARAGVAEIVATAVDNPSVSCTQKVGFYSTTPTDMLLTAVPQTIASGDVKDDLISYVKAKVVDSKGNPVRNESVSFRLASIDNGTTPMTHGPKISNETHTYGDIGASLVAMTDESGLATIYFHPGKFTRDTSDPGYSNMASGNATIQAIWNGKQENTTVSFRNYPYLSIKTLVEPQSVAVNGSVNVTIQLVGDGWALQSKPIDVVLCTDRSGSMLKNTTYGGGGSLFYSADKYPSWVNQESIDDRMVHAMRAAKIFVSQLQSSKDRIGLVSFGQSEKADLDAYGYKFWAGNDYIWQKQSWLSGGRWTFDDSDDNTYIAANYKNPQTYSGDATRDLELTSNYKDVNTTIDNWLPCGGTPMREGLYQSVQMILDNPRTDNPVKAIVLLTDGEWNTGGDPEGGSGATRFPEVETGSVIDYAKGKGIKIFTIALGDEPNHSELERYADQAGGKFYSATAGDDLTQVYEDIAQKLQEAAGVNTTMELAFGNVMINSTPASDVFRYEPLDPASTSEVKYWTDNKTIFWGPKWGDQSEDWEDDKTLTFNVGDIFLDQTWEATFRLKVLKAGNIDIFGSDSRIRFNGTQGETELGLPHTFITASLELTETDVAVSDIRLGSLSVKEVNGSPGVRILNWTLNYTGNRSVIQKVTYQFSPDKDVWWDSTWHEADTKHHSAGTDINGTYSSHLDFRKKGGWYKIRVSAWEDVPIGVSDEKTYMGEGLGDGDNPGDNSGNDPGSNPGDNSGNDPGSNPGDNSGNDPGDDDLGQPIWVESGDVGYIKIS